VNVLTNFRVFKQGGKFLDYLSDYELITENEAQCIVFFLFVKLVTTHGSPMAYHGIFTEVEHRLKLMYPVAFDVLANNLVLVSVLFIYDNITIKILCLLFLISIVTKLLYTASGY